MNPSIDVWLDEDSPTISLVILNASIIEHKGDLVPGLGLTVTQAIELAKTLMEKIGELVDT